MQDKRQTANAMYIAKALGRKGYATEGTVEDENAYLRELQERATQLNQPIPQQQPQGISRIGSGFREGFGPGEVGVTAENRAKYPVLSGTLAGPAYVLDATGRLISGSAGALSGAVGAGAEALTGDTGYGNYAQRQMRSGLDYLLNRGDVIPATPPRTGIPKQGEVLPPIREALPETVRQPVVIDQARGVLEGERPALPEPIRRVEEQRVPQLEARIEEAPPREVRPIAEEPRPVEQARPAEVVAEERAPIERELTPNELAAELNDLDPRSLEEIYGLKPRGGNWMERRTLPKREPIRLDPDLAALEAAHDLSKASPEYLAELSLHPASPTAVLRNFKKNLGFDLEQVNADGTIPLAPQAGVPDYLSKWIDTKLGKYIRNDLGTVDDPIFKLADQGVLHIPPDNLAGMFYNQFGEAANKEVRGDTRMGRSWDMAAKGNIVSGRAKIYGEQHGEANPWIEKVDPNTMIYGLRGNALDNLGFGHLVDELRAATDPNSGLPRELRLDPSKLDRVTVPQAVQLVDKINKWRAEQANTTKVQQANNAAAVPVRQYPDGYRWVEITEPPQNTPLPAAYRIIPEDGKYKLVTNYEQSGSLKTYDTLGRFDTPEEATKHAVLRDALKGEGDVMGHCVGSSPTYCKGIKSGSTKIYSLRDANGEPHVTIEARRPFRSTQAELNISEDRARQEANQRDFPDTYLGMRERDDFVYRRAYEIRQELAAERANNAPLTIEQIKGKQNRAPKEQYIPYVQDFIMNNQWSEVNELHNAGLYHRDRLEHTPPYSMKDISKDARRRALSAATEAGEVPEYVTMQQWEDILKKYLAPEEYEPRRRGGRISDHFHHDDIIPRGFYANGGFPDVIDLETKVPERKWYEPFDLETQAPNVGPWREEPAPPTTKSEPYVEREYVPYTPVEEPKPAPSPMAYAPPQPSTVGNNALAAIRRAAPPAEPPSAMPVVTPPGESPIFADISRKSMYYGDRSRVLQEPAGIVFHHTAGRGTPEGVMAALNAQKFAVHYIIDRDGRIHQSLPTNQYGIHTGLSEIPGIDNRTTLGVELIANNDQDVTPAQIEASKRLYSYLQGQYPKMQAYGHGELSTNRLPDEGYRVVMAIRGEGGKWKPSGGRQMPNVPIEKRTLGAYKRGEFKNGGESTELSQPNVDWRVIQDPFLAQFAPDTGPQGRTLEPETIKGSVGVPLAGGTLSAFGGVNPNYASMPSSPIKRDMVYPTYGMSYQKRFKDGGPVVKEALMVVLQKAKRRRGRPD